MFDRMDGALQVRHVAMDYGQFHLFTDPTADDVISAAITLATNGDGIGQIDNFIVILSPHQNNFDLELTLEVLSARPAVLDLDEWPEVFLASIEVFSQGLIYASPTLDDEVFAVPAGSYHMVVAGKDVVAHGWPGSTRPGDSWRIQMWPDTAKVAPRRLTSGRQF